MSIHSQPPLILEVLLLKDRLYGRIIILPQRHRLHSDVIEADVHRCDYVIEERSRPDQSLQRQPRLSGWCLWPYVARHGKAMRKAVANLKDLVEAQPHSQGIHSMTGPLPVCPRVIASTTKRELIPASPGTLGVSP